MPGSAADRPARLADGYLVTQLLHVALTLGMPDGRFGLTPVGELLRPGVPGSLRGAVAARGELHDRPAAGLLFDQPAVVAGSDLPSAGGDFLHVLVLLLGRERTAAEYAALCGAAGLRPTRHVPADAGVHLLEVRPA